MRNLTEQGKYDAHLLADYSREEFDELNGYINHWRDMNFAYAAVKQMEGKYLIQNRVTKRIYESPQFLYLLVAMCLFAKYPAQTRLGYVKRFYDAVSRFKISLPTPIMAGVRTPMRQFSSCVLIECDDDLDSVNATTSAIVKYVSQRAGIGINGGRIRALGSEIRGGEALHTGCLPFFKMFQAAVKSCSQGGVRGGAATLFYPLWHLEVESLLVLKNNRGVEENRIRHLDYGVQVNRLLYQRLIKSQDITLFSPHDTPGLYEAFFADQDEFERLYLQYEQDPAIRKRSLPAVELFSLMMQERASTGRIYIQNVDHCNTHSPFDPQVAPVRQSNLCMEIALPTKALSDVNGGRRNRAVHAVGLQPGRAGNAGRAGRPGRPGRARARRAARLPGLSDPGGARRHEAPPAGRGRDQLRLLPGQARHALFRTGRAGPDAPHLRSHPVLPAEGLVTAGARVRPLLGFQRNHLQRRRAADRQLQEGRGRHLRRTAAPGLGSAARRHPRARPAQLHADGADALGNVQPDRQRHQRHRTAARPGVGQAVQDGILRQVVPEFERLKDKYELLWQMSGNESYLKLVGIMQKFVDQSISANTNYDPQRYEGGRVPMKQLLKDLLLAYKYGLKTLYYHNTRDGADDAHGEVQDDGCAGGARSDENIRIMAYSIFPRPATTR